MKKFWKIDGKEFLKVILSMYFLLFFFSYFFFSITGNYLSGNVVYVSLNNTQSSNDLNVSLASKVSVCVAGFVVLVFLCWLVARYFYLRSYSKPKEVVHIKKPYKAFKHARRI